MTRQEQGEVRVDDSRGLDEIFDPWSTEMADPGTRDAFLREIGYVLRQARKASGLKMAQVADLSGVMLKSCTTPMIFPLLSTFSGRTH